MSNLLNLHETKIEINAAEINKSHCVKWPLGVHGFITFEQKFRIQEVRKNQSHCKKSQT